MIASHAAVAYWLARDASGSARALDLDADALRALTGRRLRALLVAAECAPFHAARMRAAGIPRALGIPDAELPFALCAVAPVAKEALREAGRSAMSGGRISPAWFSSQSSGSSGEPFRVYYDVRAWSTLKYLVKMRARRAAGMRTHDRVAILDAIAIDQEGRSVLERAGRVRRISVFRPPSEIAAVLAAYRPAAMYALPSALLEIARTMGSDGPRIQVRRIFTSGELLTTGARRAIEGGFGGELRDVYGTSETKEIAWECPAGSRHINADVVHVEILKDDGSVAPAGSEGEIVVTLLVNHAMPLVRYRTGDRGTLASSHCACGRDTPILGVVSGREADVLELPDGSTCSPYLLTTALEQIPGLLQYQVTQAECDLLRVTTVTGDGQAPDALARAVRVALASELPPYIRIEVSFVDRLPRGGRSKLRVVQPLPRARSGTAISAAATEALR